MVISEYAASMPTDYNRLDTAGLLPALGQRPEDPDGFGNVLGGPELAGEKMADDALAVYYEGDSTGQQAEGGRYAIGLAHRAVAVAEQEEGQAVLAGEPGVSLRSIGTDADHFGAGLFEILVLIPKGAGFGSAAGGVVLGVEIEHDLAGAQRGKRDASTPVARQGEVWRSLSGRGHGGLLFDVTVF